MQEIKWEIQKRIKINNKILDYCRDDFPFIAFTQCFVAWAVWNQRRLWTCLRAVQINLTLSCRNLVEEAKTTEEDRKRALLVDKKGCSRWKQMTRRFSCGWKVLKGRGWKKWGKELSVGRWGRSRWRGMKGGERKRHLKRQIGQQTGMQVKEDLGKTYQGLLVSQSLPLRRICSHWHAVTDPKITSLDTPTFPMAWATPYIHTHIHTH